MDDLEDWKVMAEESANANADAIEALEPRVETNEGDIDDLQDDVEANTEAIESLESMVETNTEAINDLDGDVDDI